VEQWQLVGLSIARLTNEHETNVFIGYRSEIHLVEADRRQRKPQSAKYRDAWELIAQWAPYEETHMGSPVKFGEAPGGVIPSQALLATSEKV
jgi:hypothetical protein